MRTPTSTPPTMARICHGPHALGGSWSVWGTGAPWESAVPIVFMRAAMASRDSGMTSGLYP